MSDSNQVGEVHEENMKGRATLVYALQAIGFFIPLVFIAGGILALIAKGDAKGTAYETHLRWAWNTFLYSALWTAVAVVVTLVLMWIGLFFIGWIIGVCVFIWTVYRVIKGFVSLSDKKPMY